MIGVGDLDEAIGGEVWPSAHVLLRWLEGARSLDVPELHGATLLELGAGTGFLALALTDPNGANLHRIHDPGWLSPTLPGCWFASLFG